MITTVQELSIKIGCSTETIRAAQKFVKDYCGTGITNSHDDDCHAIVVEKLEAEFGENAELRKELALDLRRSLMIN
jgi:hypothetical protein